MTNSAIGAELERIGRGERKPLYLVEGEQVLADREARRLADALAEAAGCKVTEWRRPADLAPILADLQTFSLFDAAKVVLVSQSAVVADRQAATDLIDEAEKALPVTPGEPLTRDATQAAGRLLQVFRLFGVEPDGSSPEAALAAIGSLPTWVLQGGERIRKRNARGRSRKACDELASGLAGLLETALAEGLEGGAEGDLAELDRIARSGLPDGHALVLAERSVDAEHPLVKRLQSEKAFFRLASLAKDRRGRFEGLEPVVFELTRETGVGITREAAEELARRTLRGREGQGGGVQADSAARFDAEYRKLAGSVPNGAGLIEIGRVREVVVDRGDEDVWALLDAVGRHNAGEALGRLRRHLDTAPKRSDALFRFFGLFASFCQQLSVVHGALPAVGGPVVSNYNAFKSRVLPRLAAELPDSMKRMSPYRLHKTYLAATARRGPEATALMAELPWLVLQTEVQLKGGSDDTDTALEALVAAVASAGRPSPRNAPRRSAYQRRTTDRRGPSGPGRRGPAPREGAWQRR